MVRDEILFYIINIIIINFVFSETKIRDQNIIYEDIYEQIKFKCLLQFGSDLFLLFAFRLKRKD
jgi:hypothetical protein